MMGREFDDAAIAMLMGSIALALIFGALGFEYLGHLPPCELCMWQRYPHVAAAFVGIGGALLVRRKVLPASSGAAVAILAILLIAASGAIGIYHAGVEWHWWKGPSACTSGGFQYSGGTLDLNAPVVMCDYAQWRLFGISLAGYNALLSLAVASAGFYLVAGSKRAS